jgi:hypothetical protein
LTQLYEVSAGVPREIVIVSSMAVDRLIATGDDKVDDKIMSRVAEDYMDIRVQRINDQQD